MMPQANDTEDDEGSQDMAERKAEPEPNEPPAYETRDIDPEHTLVPMLVGGLVLIVLGAIVVMVFV